MLHHQLANIDIYLLDQLLRGRIPQHARILDAGCGGGRNIAYLLSNGYSVSAIDADPLAIEALQSLHPSAQPGQFRCEAIENISFPAASFDFIIASAVLHFASHHAHFDAMLTALWRTLSPGGILFARLASSIGIESLLYPLPEGRYLLPDGSERYLVDAPTLHQYESRWSAAALDPLKTTIVENQRAMTTWVVQKLA